MTSFHRDFLRLFLEDRFFDDSLDFEPELDFDFVIFARDREDVREETWVRDRERFDTDGRFKVRREADVRFGL